jgi:hypothetical protein
MTDRRRALLAAALGFLQLREQPAEVTLLRRWLDSWAGLSDVITGLDAPGLSTYNRARHQGHRA